MDDEEFGRLTETQKKMYKNWIKREETQKHNNRKETSEGRGRVWVLLTRREDRIRRLIMLAIGLLPSLPFFFFLTVNVNYENKQRKEEEEESWEIRRGINSELFAVGREKTGGMEMGQWEMEEIKYNYNLQVVDERQRFESWSHRLISTITTTLILLILIKGPKSITCSRFHSFKKKKCIFNLLLFRLYYF